jgi:protocatechuate 3,4-dioxygenase beta subunit
MMPRRRYDRASARREKDAGSLDVAASLDSERAMKRGWLPAIGVFVVVAVLAFVAHRFLKDESPVVPIESAKAAAAEPPPAPAPVPASDAATTAATRRVEAPNLPAAEPPPTTPMPASYRKALSGVHGRLVEEDGKPVPGLEVELLELVGNSMVGDFEHAFAADAKTKYTMPELTVARGRSGEDGVFQLDGALRGAFHGLGVDLKGARATLRFVDRTLQASKVLDLGDVVLTPCVTWKGKVVDEDGNPVADARVRATPLPILIFQPGVADVGRVAAVMEVRRWDSGRVEVYDVPESVRAWDTRLPFPTTRSKADGSFELAGVPSTASQPVTLIVDRDGFAGMATQMQSSKRDRDVGNLEIGRGRTIHGTVVDTAGKPVANAQAIGGVVIEAANLAIGYAAAAPTDAEGHFTIEHLSELGGSVKVAARSRPSERYVTADADGDHVTVTLPVGFPVDVKLVAKGHGTNATDGVVDDAELSIRLTDGPPFLTWGTLQKLPADQVEHVEAGHLRIAGVHPGRFDVVGRASGYGLAVAHVEVKDGPAEAKLEFTSARTLTVGVFERESKKPIEYAEVSAAVHDRMQPALVTRRTDAAGTAQLPDLPSESLVIRAYHPAFAATSQTVKIGELPADATRVDLLLGPGATLHGIVHRSAQSAAEPMLFTLEPGGERQSADDDMPIFAVPGLDGTFTLEGLRPGEHRWEFIPRLFDGDPQLAASKLMQLAQVSQPKRGKVVLEEGKTTELELDAVEPGKPGKVTGILHVKGRSDAAFRIHVQANAMRTNGEQREPTVKTLDVRANQHFTIEPVPPGWVNVGIERVAGERPAAADPNAYFGPQIAQDWFELTDGEEHKLELEFEFASAQVRVVDPSGAPIANTGVTFEWKETVSNGDSSTYERTQNLWAQTNQEGVALIELPRPGHYTARSAQSGKGRGVVEFDAPTREPVELRVESGVPCAGRVEVEPDPGAAAKIWFSVYELKDEQNWGDNVGWQQFENGKRDFELAGLRPGRYRAQIYLQSGDSTNWSRNSQTDFELSTTGNAHLVLHFKTAK